MDVGKISYINGPVIKAKNISSFKMRDMVTVGQKRLIGEVISLDKDEATVQVYEDTAGLRINEEVISTGKPLSVRLGPGIIGNIFDGIQRPLEGIVGKYKTYIPQGVGPVSLDVEKIWDVKIMVKIGDIVSQGQVYGSVQETHLIEHRLTVPPGISGEVVFAAPDGKYTLSDVLINIKNIKGRVLQIRQYQEWPVRIPRPIYERLHMDKPLITGQRVLDTFFPIAKGGAAAIPGGFGTGKTMTQHQLAKWSDADIIIYVGCGERGNEMTAVLEEFPELIDPKSGRPLMDRTVLIANTSNMPVAAREASIYTGITIAEYFRDMGYHVAMMADSTSRWAEALREISGRLEEMPAEEGFPAYLPSRLAEFYERAGYVTNLNKTEGSITLIGAVSPPGGEFSEPVTENTRRFTGVFWGLDKGLAYSRHYPSVNWLKSYSKYLPDLEGWYSKNIAEDMIILRNKMMRILLEENRLLEIVKLVGEDVLPDDQRFILEIAAMIRVGFLQQNAFHKEDTFVPIKKQYRMLKIIDLVYEKGLEVLKKGIPVSKIKGAQLYNEIIKMKYNIPGDNNEMFDNLQDDINRRFTDLGRQYE